MVSEAAEPWIGTIDEAYTIRGRVYSDSADPLPGVVVTLVRYAAGDEIQKGYSKVFDTSEDGWFQVSGLLPGPYDAIFKKRGYDSVVREIDPTSYNDEAVVMTRTPAPEESRESGVLCLATSTKTGRMVIGGRILIQLEELSTSTKHLFVEQIDAGSLYLNEIPVGLYRAVFWIQGYAPTVLDGVVVARDCERPLEIEVESGQAVRVQVTSRVRSTGVLTIVGQRCGLILDRKPLTAREVAAAAQLQLAPDEYTAEYETDSGALASATFTVASVVAAPVVVALEATLERNE